jgi:hypothetical protein
MREETKEVKHLWQEYRAAVSSQGVPDSRADWFVRWAQRFARAMLGLPLRALTKAYMIVVRDGKGQKDRVTMLPHGSQVAL